MTDDPDPVGRDELTAPTNANLGTSAALLARDRRPHGHRSCMEHVVRENTMITSAAGRALLESFEGKELSAYRDDRGNWTIGYGHLLLPDELATGKLVTGVMWWGGITQADADQLLAHDLGNTETAVNGGITVPLSQHQFDALVCLVFNIGGGAFQGSSVRTCINAGDAAGTIAAHWELWNKSGEPPTTDPVLTRRRAAEVAYYGTPD